MPDLENASRRVPKATYVPLVVPTAPTTGAGAPQQAAPDQASGGAVVKYGFVRQLALQPGETAAAIQEASRTGGLSPSAEHALRSSAPLLSAFEGQPINSGLPPRSAFASVPSTNLAAFGRALARVRQRPTGGTTQRAGATAPPGQPDPAVPSAPAAAAARAGSPVQPGHVDALDVALSPAQMHLVNTANAATTAFEQGVAASPIGMLNLERIEMTPAGIERGELIATIPLAPGEQTSVTQTEWTVTSQEFTSIVTDSLENVSQTGVTEKTDLAQSTDSETQHDNQFNITASVSGSYGCVTASASSSFAAQDKSSQSAKESRDHAIATTRSASSRVRQEHKTTITTTTVSGTSEATTRTLQNTTADPMRIDYFSLMRKWRVRLYRYGLRLTYDIAIPEPGGALREAHRNLSLLEAAAQQGFDFPVNAADITIASYQSLAKQYGAQVPPPPAQTGSIDVPAPTPGLGPDDDSWHFFSASFSVPDGAEIAGIHVVAMMNINNKGTSDNGGQHHFIVLGSDLNDMSGTMGYDEDVLRGGQPFLQGGTGPQTITFFTQWVGTASISFTVSTVPTAQTTETWQNAVWSALYNAAQSTYYTNQQAVTSQISALQAQIGNADTLTLRREENDEIMKGVLRWLLGTQFEFMPPSVVDLFTQQKDSHGNPVNDVTYGVSFTGNDLGLSSPTSWSTMYQYQEMVKFINEAIEWENVLYFLYSYFWDVPASWDFIRTIEHPDKTRQAFLRAGSARVVLPVRKGYEARWTAFVELGDLTSTIPPGTSPYMTIAQEIQDYDDTNYPGIPPANPGGPDLASASDAVAACAVALSPSTAQVSIPVDSTADFLVGSQAIIDTNESGVREVQTILAVPDATHLVVAALAHAHDGTTTPFPIAQQGELGLLIAEWFEYTPTSGTDIAVTSNLTTIA